MVHCDAWHGGWHWENHVDCLNDCVGPSLIQEQSGVRVLEKARR